MRLNAEVMTIMGDPLFQAVWLIPSGSEADYARVQHNYELQLHHLQWAYARFEVLANAQLRGVVFDRDLSKSVPAKVRQWAFSDLNTMGLIEKDMEPGGWALTQAGREFIRSNERFE